VATLEKVKTMTESSKEVEMLEPLLKTPLEKKLLLLIDKKTENEKILEELLEVK